MHTILVIDDHESMREGAAEVLRRMGHRVLLAASGREGLELFDRNKVDLTITDFKMENMTGLEVLRQILQRDPAALVIIITAFGTIDVAVSAMQEGAFDFIAKPFKPALLEVRVQRALDRTKLVRESEKLRAVTQQLPDEQQSRPGMTEIIGSSPKMKDVFETIRRVGKTDSSVLITGESGTGKELIARAVHEQSNRRNGPFIAVHCGALAETLLESELFGHEKGSFTSAVKRRLGRFEMADTGTLFLDEIGEIPPATQVKLLRVLQERQFERVGGEETVNVDVRLVAATNRNLRDEVQAGRFREDLYYRLNVVPIVVPPLRERKEDIGLIAEHFLRRLVARTHKEIKGIAPDAITRLTAYSWPGNVRELENVIEQAMIFSDGEILVAKDLPAVLRGDDEEGAQVELPDEDLALDKVLEDVERRLILRAYKQAGGVKTETARLLGIKTSALYYKLEKYGIQ